MTPLEKPFLEFRSFAGRSLDDCWITVHASDRPHDFGWSAVDSYLLRKRGEAITVVEHRWMSIVGLWVSPRGAIYMPVMASGHSGLPNAVWVGRPEADGRVEWTFPEATRDAVGVWGLSDDRVFAWGGSFPADARDDFLCETEGAEWVDLPSPGYITAMHGTDESCLYAVGQEPDRRPMIARWSDGDWHPMQVPAGDALRCVHVVSPHEIYAGGNGRLLVGSEYGWSEREVRAWPETVHSIQRWRGAIWIATSGMLARLDPSGVEPMKEGPFFRMRAGETLMAMGRERMVDTEDGERFHFLDIEEIADVLEGRV